MDNAIHNTSNSGLLTEMMHKFQSLKIEYMRQKQINKTIKELSALTDRELLDIGITRGMIRSIAMETYFDNRS